MPMRCKSWPALIPGTASGVDTDHFVGSAVGAGGRLSIGLQGKKGDG
jgi:hypothetical protein